MGLFLPLFTLSDATGHRYLETALRHCYIRAVPQETARPAGSAQGLGGDTPEKTSLKTTIMNIIQPAAGINPTPAGTIVMRIIHYSS